MPLGKSLSLKQVQRVWHKLPEHVQLEIVNLVVWAQWRPTPSRRFDLVPVGKPRILGDRRKNPR